MSGSGGPVTARAPAKVNLALGVGAPRGDGFHPLVTVYQALALYDEVTVSRATETTVTVEGDGVAVRDVPTDAANLALRAAVALAEHHRMAPADAAVAMHVRKRIPVAGGMAGGSADAAAALRACDRLWGLGTPDRVLGEVAAALGSDVPFCLLGGTAVGEGRGELVTPVPDGGAWTWVAAMPGGGLSTPGVYAELDRLRPQAEPPRVPVALLEALQAGDVDRLAATLSNDLQAAALSLRPELGDLLAQGRSAGAVAAQVSGSGPTCLFLAGDLEHGERLAGRVRGEGLACLVATGPAPGAQVLDPL
jgi:4-diphosphocytidyl-2-C-methyl-D-erythritol kinase